jgi:hypothetical protein
LQALFDVQITKLFQLIDKQLQRMQQKLPQEQVVGSQNGKNDSESSLNVFRRISFSQEVSGTLHTSKNASVHDTHLVHRHSPTPQAFKSV